MRLRGTSSRHRAGRGLLRVRCETRGPALKEQSRFGAPAQGGQRPSDVRGPSSFGQCQVWAGLGCPWVTGKLPGPVLGDVSRHPRCLGLALGPSAWCLFPGQLPTGSGAPGGTRARLGVWAAPVTLGHTRERQPAPALRWPGRPLELPWAPLEEQVVSPGPGLPAQPGPAPSFPSSAGPPPRPHQAAETRAGLADWTGEVRGVHRKSWHPVGHLLHQGRFRGPCLRRAEEEVGPASRPTRCPQQASPVDGGSLPSGGSPSLPLTSGGGPRGDSCLLSPSQA